ncbi:MAG: TonB-dependent receptor plug domain-containing protein, partial [candidate division Zixibacteria bacterium]|nr:TonB-dependent receptor plug domain-containing protein [candidate division Zixibacteria bacterium]
MTKSINFLNSTILLLVFFLIPIPLGAEDKFEESMFNLPLEEVMDVHIITASRRDESAKNAPGIISVITRKQIEQSGARGLTDILNMVPGFSSGAWANSTSIYVRGAYSEGKSNNILLMIDGRRINTCFHGNAFEHYDIPVRSIKQVEIIRGPGSVLYGANASVAVINIITESGEEIDGAELSYRAGSFESHYGWIKAGKRVNDDFEFSISGNMTKYNNTSLPHEDFTVSGEKYTNLRGADVHDIYSVEGRITFKDLTFHASYIDSSHGLAGAGLDKSLDVEDFLSGSDKDEYSLGVIHKYKWLDNINITSSLTYGGYRNEFTSVAAGFPHYYSAVGNGLKAETVTKTWSDYFDGEVNLDWFLSEKHLFLIGFNFRKETIKSENWRDLVWGVIGGEPAVAGRTDPYLVNTAIDSETREIHAEYAQYTFKPS